MEDTDSDPVSDSGDHLQKYSVIAIDSIHKPV